MPNRQRVEYDPRRKHSLAGEAMNVVHAVSPTHLHLRQRLIQIWLLTLAVDAVSSVGAFLLERHAKDTEIHTIGSAFFWTTAQLLTVSSQMKNPITFGGRALDLFLEAYAITVVAALAAMFGAFFHRRGVERHAVDHAPRSTG